MYGASWEWKTAENLFNLLKKSTQDVEHNWGAVAVAAVTDASGESWKAWDKNFLI